MTTDQTTTAGTICDHPDHTACTHPEGATLHLGGTAWAHPDAAPHLHPTDTLTPYPGNPRRGDQDAITASIRDLGLYRPLITHNHRILAGNHTYRALLDLGAHLVPSTAVDVSETRAAAIVARDNRTSDLGVYDDAELLALLTADEEVLALSGYADAPAELLLMQRRAEAEDVFTVGTDHMLDEFKEISGTGDPTYRAEYVRGVNVYLRDKAAVEDFKTRLGITGELGPRLPYPLDWEMDDRRLAGRRIIEEGENQ